MASQSQSTCVAQRNLVRRSSTCTCGSWRVPCDQLGGGRVEPFCQCRQDDGNLL
jgi:hypothetical protein